MKCNILFFVLISFCLVIVSTPIEEVWTAYTYDSALLGGRDVRSAAIGPNGFLWIGTSNGLMMFDGVSWTNFTVEDGLGSNSIGEIAIDKDGVVWAISGGLSRYKDGEWTISAQQISGSLAIAPNGDVWISRGIQVLVSPGDGILHYDGESWETFPRYEELGEYSFGAITVSSDGIVWSAVEFFGVCGLECPTAIGVSRYDGESWTRYSTDDKSFGYTTSSVAVDLTDKIWIATTYYDGLYSFYNGAFTRITGEDGLPWGRIFYVTFGPDGDMWVAIDLNLVRYDGENWTVFTEEDGLTSGWYVSDMAFDTNGAVVAVKRTGTRDPIGGFYILGELSIGAILTDVETDSNIPETFAILGNYPNPFNPSTTITFSIPEKEFTSLVIYNIAGQKVRELVSRTMSGGIHNFIWDGRDDNGNTVSSGVYMSRLTNGNLSTNGRMVLMK